MCYDAYYLTKRNYQYAKRYGATEKEIEELAQELERLRKMYELDPLYHATGFSHPLMLAVTNDKPKNFTLLKWGLIPSWCKDLDTAQKMWNNTINARGETMFEKPSFKKSAESKRCVILIDGFFEHHHYKGKTYPFKIHLKNDEPMLLGGIYNSWINKVTGEEFHTVSIVTTKGNPIMEKIHNNPKLEFGPRMPFILPDEPEIIAKWLHIDATDKVAQEEVLSLIEPYPEEELQYHTAPRLRGKEAIGNIPEALEKCGYPELVFDDPGKGQISLF